MTGYHAIYLEPDPPDSDAWVWILILILLAWFLLATGVQAKPAPRHCWQDKKWWAGESVILGMAAVQGVATSRVRDGGTYAFGNRTTNGKIIAFESLVNVPVFTTEHWFAWHVDHDDQNKYWRFVDYSAVPAADAAVGLWIETHTHWGHKAGPYPF